MSDKDREQLTEEELEAAKGEPLPPREVMSIVSTDGRPIPLDGGAYLDGESAPPVGEGDDDILAKPGPQPMAVEDDRLEQ